MEKKINLSDINVGVLGDTLDAHTSFPTISAIPELLASFSEIESNEGYLSLIERRILFYKKLGYPLDYSDPEICTYLSQIIVPYKKFSDIMSSENSYTLSDEAKKTEFLQKIFDDNGIFDVLQVCDNLGNLITYYYADMFFLDYDDEDSGCIFNIAPTFIGMGSKNLTTPPMGSYVQIDLEQVKKIIIEGNEYEFCPM